MWDYHLMWRSKFRPALIAWRNSLRKHPKEVSIAYPGIPIFERYIIVNKQNQYFFVYFINTLFLEHGIWSQIFMSIFLWSTFSFYVADKLYTGMDRVHFIEKATGDASAKELRLALPEAAAPGRKVKLTFYYDFTSPWSYIANEYVWI